MTIFYIVKCPTSNVNFGLNILQHHLALLTTANADIVININTGKNNYRYQFVNGQDKILAGEKAVKEILPKLQEMICQKSRGGLKKYFEFFKR